MRVLLALGALALAAGCGDSLMSPSGAGGTLNVMIRDTPFGDARSLLVTFSEVAAHRSENRWTTLPFADGGGSRTCDLKKLETAQDVLGTGPLEPGHYTQLRLVVSRATLFFENAADGPPCAPAIVAPEGRSAAVEIPSGEVRLNREFDVTSAGATTIVLDFDGHQSVHETGNGRFRMTPVIAVVSVQ